jgi:hypothetical protein
LWSPEDQSLEALLKEFHQIISTTHAPEHQLTTTMWGDQLTATKNDQLTQGDQLTNTTEADQPVSSSVHPAAGKEKNCMYTVQKDLDCMFFTFLTDKLDLESGFS